MALAQLFIQPEAAYYTISELGEAGIVQFKDLNEEVSAFLRKFANEVRRCDEMERRLRYIETEVKKDKIAIPECAELPRAPNPREIINLEAHLEKTEGDIRELTENGNNLKLNYLELTELKHVLEKTKTFFNEDDEPRTSTMESRALMVDELNTSAGTSQHLSFVSGVINRERVPAFERMLWRISRGNALFRQAMIETPFEDPVNGKKIYKTVFMVFFQGEQLKSRVKKVCAGFHATLYICPSNKVERTELENNLRVRLQDLNTVLNQTNDHRQRVLTTVVRELHNWTVMVKKMKAIYHTLNMFNMDVSKKCLIGECWMPKNKKDLVQQALHDGFTESGSSIPSFLNIICPSPAELPPTYNQTNKFTHGFQALIDSYGVASYRELNPALYTIITFPFLFAVMFGDAGHGAIVLAFGAYMVICEKKLSAKKSTNEIWNIFFGGRYIILLMGLFSVYTGFIYNDVFSKSMNIFQSGWFIPFNKSTVLENSVLQLNPKNMTTGSPYEFGLDPVWQLAQNKILFLNTYKMKLSIIFGVVHMIFGVCLSVVNYTHFKKYSSIFLDFLPQLIFLVLIFFWLVTMMFLKFVLYGATFETKYSTSCAPSILILFINMVLFKSNKPPKDCVEHMFDGQKTLQMVFLIVAVLCIPVMLFGKPIYILRNNGDLHNSNNSIELQNEIKDSQPSHAHASHDDHEDGPASEVFITQGIHTIEYVLSTVSHTASYLRLWALSLAHAQLSEVLWNMVLHMGFIFNGFVGAPILFLIFAVWAMLTLAILVMMEGLSAFLHTLRLHWVEFMSKFYTGLGYAFQPFSFRTILNEEDEKD
ncbi:hypothetical protein RN001_004317 [Aquatica leii]|uniref:V-type proton ATPase subunit a n=1 Tax=Aquatica leii TaxID=1421715 RepID=A0AAN7QJG8_9COLE|nr:hypothetical protein RN001_004317 [Aquatica leii]